MSRLAFFALLALALASCQTTTTHQFATPAPVWQIKTGQLAYKSPKISLIGEVLVRTSPAGDLELVFSKGPGVNLLILRQDAQYASATGPLARGSWAGPTAQAPVRLRGWFALREKILAGGNAIQTKAGRDSFNLRF
ncbi:MAG: hypothetical protein ACR2NX_05120 [Chthoniobacterales bacterium]